MNSLVAALLASSLVIIQCYMGGTRPAFAIPGWILLGLAGILAFFAKTHPAPRWTKRCAIIAATAFAYLLWRAFHSPYEYLARTDISSMLACLVAYGLTAFIITTPGPRVMVLCTLFLLCTAEVVIGTRQFTYDDNWLPFNLGTTAEAMVSRASGTFANPAHFAGFLEIIGPFALALAIWGGKATRIRTFSGYVAVVCYFGIAISGSRGAWISAAFSLLVLLVMSLELARRLYRRYFLITLLLAVAAAGAVAFTTLDLMRKDERLTQRLELAGAITERKIAEYDMRAFNWMAAVDQWRESPVTGTGAGTHLYYGRKYRRPALQAEPVHAHNDYLELLAEYGILGAIAVGAVLIVHALSGAAGFRRLAAERAEDPYNQSHSLAIAVGAISAMSAYLAHSAVDFNMHIPGNAATMALVFGFLATPCGRKANEAQESADGIDEGRPHGRPQFRLLQFAIPAVAIWLLVNVTPRLRSEFAAERSWAATQAGAFDEAVAQARRGIQLDPRNPYLHFNLGQALRLQAASLPPSVREEHLKSALEAYEQAVAICDKEVEFLLRKALCLDAMQRFSEAQSAYTKALLLDPNQWVPRVYFAEHLKNVGDYRNEAAMRQSAQALNTNIDMRKVLKVGKRPKKPAEDAE